MEQAAVLSAVTSVQCLDDIRCIKTRTKDPHRGDGVVLKIGVCAIRLVFHSQCLKAAILPAFQHLISNGDTSLTVHLHDFASAPGAVKIVDRMAPFTEAGALRLIDDDALTCFTQAQGKVLSAIDWNRSEAHWIVHDAADISYMERSGPLRHLLAHWLTRHGQHLVHAAAVSDQQGAVLILGHGGAGKSTTALACLEGGLGYLGDDHCLLEAGRNPTVNSLFSTGKLALSQLPDFPVLSAAARTDGRPPDEKAVLYLASLEALPLRRRVPLRSILVAHITGLRETVLRPISRSLAFRAMVPSCALHFPSARPNALDCFGSIARELPAYVLELGTNRESLRGVIRTLLEAPSSEATIVA